MYKILVCYETHNDEMISTVSRMELTPTVTPAESNTAAVVGGVVGGLFFVLLLILAVIAIVMCRCRRNKGIIYKATE